MRILLKVLLLLAIIVTMCLGVFFVANKGLINYPLQKVVECISSMKGVNLKLENFKFKDYTASADRAVISLQEGKIQTKKINILVKPSWNKGSPKIQIKSELVNVEIHSSSKLACADYSCDYIKYLGSTGRSIKSEIKNIKLYIEEKMMHSGNAVFSSSYVNKRNVIDFDLSLGEDIHIKAVTSEDHKIKITAQQVPLLLYKLPYELFKDDGLLKFFAKFIRGGKIKNAKFVIDPSKDLSDKSSIVGNGLVENCELTYGDHFPNIKNMQINIDIEGPKFRFYVDEGYSTNIKLYDGVVKLDWKGKNKSTLYIDAKGEGPATCLTDFITEQQHHKINKANIDLRPVTGNANVDIKIEIPLIPGVADIFDISASIPDANLSIFNDSVKLTNTDINGKFDGEKITLNGVGLINGFNSNLDFVLNIKNKSEFDHKLDVKTHFKASKNNKKIAFVNLLQGEADIYLNYINKDSKGIIKVESDLTNLGLYFEKLGIKKKEKTVSELEIKGKFEDVNAGNFDFKVISDEKMNIEGNAILKDNNAIFNINKLQNKRTNLEAKILISSDLFDANIWGDSLDLSETDTLKLLEKEQDSGAANLQIKTNSIFLKNNIELKQVNLNLKCQDTGCFYGKGSAIINNSPFSLMLINHKFSEEWAIMCADAGSLLKGLDIYKSMEGGILTLNINTNREEVASGKILPIHNGVFKFKDFALSNPSRSLKFVSIASLSGLFDFISGNKNIMFNSLEGKFNFQNKLLRVTDTIGKGPYMNFFISGDIDTNTKYMNLKGHVTPKYFGVGTVVKAVPIVGNLFKGNKKRQGLISKAFKLKEHY